MASIYEALAGLSIVYRFHDNKLDMPPMEKDDYYWRNRITVKNRVVPELEVRGTSFLDLLPGSSNHDDANAVFSDMP